MYAQAPDEAHARSRPAHPCRTTPKQQQQQQLAFAAAAEAFAVEYHLMFGHVPSGYLNALGQPLDAETAAVVMFMPASWASRWCWRTSTASAWWACVLFHSLGHARTYQAPLRRAGQRRPHGVHHPAAARAGAAQWATQPPPPPARCPLERAVHNLLPGGGVLAYTERSLWLACEQVSTW